MLCEQCAKNVATIHFAQVVNGKKNEMHLCGECAKAQGAFSLQAVSSLFAGLLYENPTRASGVEVTRCGRCGLTYGKFKETGMLGCAQCYTEFRKQLAPVLQRIHGRVQHEGHIPHGAGDALQVKRQIETKRREMQAAVDQEDFEKAAALRDELKELQTQMDAQIQREASAQAAAPETEEVQQDGRA